jgi:hypothetical protein
MDILEKLDQLANFYAQKEVLDIQKAELIAQVLTPEIRARLEEIEAEFATRVQAVNDNISALEAEIKGDVLQNAGSVKGTFLRAVWNRGRVTWDTKGMDSYASDHPEVLAFRKQGEPYVSITKVDR